MERRTAAASVTGGQGSYGRESAELYAEIGLEEANFWLIHRHAELALRRWLGPDLSKVSAVDWGCGAGKSTRWLKALLLRGDVCGADINEEMLTQARARDPGGRYVLAPGGRCPFDAPAFDLVLSMVVLIELPCRASLHAYAAEAYRLLRPGGLALAASATEESHDPANRFLSFRYVAADAMADPHNRNLRSGDRVVVRNNNGLCMEDFFWSRSDCEGAFEAAGFQVAQVTRTLGVPTDPFEWQDELRVATDYVFVFRKPVDST